MAKKKRLGGKRLATWDLVVPEEILAYRAQHSMSRATMAAVLGVSTTTIQNWETGKGVATQRAQLRIRSLLTSPQPAPTRELVKPPRTEERGGPATIETTGQIMAAYLAGGAHVELDQVAGLVRQVRAALV